MLTSSRGFLVIASFAAAGASGGAQISGSIYTSSSNGTTVNGNIYTGKNQVYLSGGPGPNAPCTAGGLPSGRYYFQVTNPSGSALLSSDAIANREVTVAGGVIVSHSGTHKTGNGLCGSKTVQLVPFADTPSSGSEYKLWVTPVDRYDPSGGGFFGFISKYSKTDNFKVKGPGKLVQQSVIRGFKFFDINENGVWDASNPLEVPIAGWRIEILKAGLPDGLTYTDEAGRYMFIRDLDGSSYTIREVAPPPGFVPNPGAIWAASTPTQANVLANAESVAGPLFGNLSLERKFGLGRTKGFWHNDNGRALLAACDPQWRTALNGTTTNPVCLRRNVSTADPLLSIFLVPAQPVPFATAFDAWANYIVGNPALGHGGFILSSQVAPSILSNSCGFMQGPIYVDLQQNGVLMSFKTLLAGAVGLLCDPNAGLTGPNDPYQDLRARMLGCLNEFEAINNTGDLNNAQIVFGPTTTPAPFAIPY